MSGFVFGVVALLFIDERKSEVEQIKSKKKRKSERLPPRWLKLTRPPESGSQHHLVICFLKGCSKVVSGFGV